MQTLINVAGRAGMMTQTGEVKRRVGSRNTKKGLVSLDGKNIKTEKGTYR
jgi:hypothetical protein